MHDHPSVIARGGRVMEQSHHDVGAMIPLTPEQCRRAALAVCAQARDLEDAALLLDALGLRTALRSMAIPA
jgi:hypothetical protein